MTRMVTFADFAAEILRRPARLGPVRLVAVDGPSGAGKTLFAVRLAAALRTAGKSVETVGTDDLLDGWDDIVTFWPRLEATVLAPLRRGEPGGYQRYDWRRGRFSGVVVPVPVPEVLILEGVTSARADMRREATVTVFITAPAPLRRKRALDRDAAVLDPAAYARLEADLDRWAAAEKAHFLADRTRDRVDFVLDGGSGVEDDPEGAFVRFEDAEVGDGHI